MGYGMRNIALLLEYDGLPFHGWQSQANAAAVQDIVAEAICRLDGRAKVRLTGASRTDAGVHARGQVANFFTDSKIPAEKYAYALNTLLPGGISCTGSAQAPPQFHARFGAVGKLYSYSILNRRFPSALSAARSWHVPEALDLRAMRAAADLIVGERDFRAFMAAGSPVSSTVRTVWELSLRRDGEVVEMRVSGDGFLYNMVRIIAGTLAYVGMGKLESADVGRILLGGDRKAAGKTAPPQGLCLERVYYGEELFPREAFSHQAVAAPEERRLGNGEAL
jgi:tRNA pseudouridine38-40 synthase